MWHDTADFNIGIGRNEDGAAKVNRRRMHMGRKLNLAVVGVSGRGMGLMGCIFDMEDVHIRVVCDLYADRMQAASDMILEKCGYRPDMVADYREAVSREDVDCVITPSTWQSHVEISLAAMNAGKPVAMEVGGAYSIQECWDLVRTSERTGKTCMMLENCCYGRNELAVLNMVKQGVFGELIHCQGGYQHDLRKEAATGFENRHYLFPNSLNRNGDLYPTHESGPIAKFLDINRGNRFISLVSMSSKSRGIHEWIVKHKGADHPQATLDFRLGDIVTTMIKCAHGETVMLIHDTSLPRVYSRGGRVQGTKGIWMEDRNACHIEGVSAPEDWENLAASWDPMPKILEQYEHPLWREFLNDGVRGGHGGMDYLVLRAFFESVLRNEPAPIDVYDTATWMAITCLSEDSVAMGSMPVAFPDFTCGKWFCRTAEPSSRYALSRVCDECFTIPYGNAEPS
jgi:hypothetical protein